MKREGELWHNGQYDEIKVTYYTLIKFSAEITWLWKIAWWVRSKIGEKYAILVNNYDFQIIICNYKPDILTTEVWWYCTKSIDKNDLPTCCYLVTYEGWAFDIQCAL